ncbi:hypothetical protein FQR65_LT07128 [Abscondita terminalis]|nr:hypothetical protein FQR65_LT07128 [Abscondita terminalis]
MAKVLSPLAKYKNECLEESKIDPEMLEKLLVDITIPKTEESKCYLRYDYSRAGVIDDEFKIDVIAVKNWLPAELTSVAHEMIKKCDKVGIGSDCFKAYEILSPLGMYKDECLIKSKAEPESVEKFLVDVYVTKTEELQNYIICAYSKFKLISEDDQLDSKVLKELLPPDFASVADEIIGNCNNIDIGSYHTRTYPILRCVFYDVRGRFSN